MLLTCVVRVLLATVRDMGECPCPRCLIRKDQIHHIGTKRDRISRASKARVDNQHRQTKVRLARNIIYEKGRVVNSKGVEQLLKSQSLVPTEVNPKCLNLNNEQDCVLIPGNLL